MTMRQRKHGRSDWNLRRERTHASGCTCHWNWNRPSADRERARENKALPPSSRENWHGCANPRNVNKRAEKPTSNDACALFPSSFLAVVIRWAIFYTLHLISLSMILPDRAEIAAKATRFATHREFFQCRLSVWSFDLNRPPLLWRHAGWSEASLGRCCFAWILKGFVWTPPR